MTATPRLKIKEWSEEDRPREKLSAHGAEALTNAELLAILIGSGSAEETSVSLMQRVLSDCGDSLSRLGKLSKAQLCQYKGIGEAKAITIQAAMELARRREREQMPERPFISSPNDIFSLMHPKLRDSDIEEAWLLLLNQKSRLIAVERISRGGFTETTVDVRLILREALLNNATIIALCHNHPSGNPRPSRDDDHLTDSVKAACRTMRIHLLDHVIIADGQYYSYSERGKI